LVYEANEDIMNILTFDLECENHRKMKRVASPFDERNYIVQIGWSINGGERYEKYYTEWHRDPVLPSLKDIDMIVGFNIKFDLLWVWSEQELTEFFEKGGTVYCGQYAEYLLNGMNPEYHMCSMDQIIESYGGTLKIDAVKELWNDGVLTSEVPKDLLTDYLVGDGAEIVGDVHNTWLIFIGQVARMNAEHPAEFKTMLKFRMDGLLATTEMEYNGLYVNMDVAEKNRVQCKIDLEAASMELEQFIPELPPELEFKWSSPQKKSCLIFGGTVSYKKWLAHSDAVGNVIYCKKTEKHPMFTYNGRKISIRPEKCVLAGALYVYELSPKLEVVKGLHVEQKGKRYLIQERFKGGKNVGLGKFQNVTVPDTDKPKGALTDHYFKFDGYVQPKAKWKGESTDAYDQPLYSVAADVIDELALLGLPFTDALSTLTKLSKILGTYYMVGEGDKAKGMMTLVNANGIIHHKLNHTSTVTSRLSSSDPNLQNIPRAGTSNVKEAFESRFGTGGLLAEIDYSQLEIVVQQVMTGDIKLGEDLRNKIDFHCKRVATAKNEDYQHVWNMCHVEEDKTYKAERTKKKIFSFQRAYGGGAALIAAETGMDLQEVKDMIVAEDIEYPAVPEFDRMLEKNNTLTRINSGKKLYINGVAFTQGEAHWDSPTGTRYTFREGIAPKFMQDRGIYVGFSPTERKNYPVQGFAGEIVQTMFGLVFRHMIAKKRYGGSVLLCNTVHDCGVIDGKKELIPTVAKEVQKILESVPEVFNTAYSAVNVTVPFPCETEVGANLYNMDVMK
jgi:DNA polymerase-1